MCLSALPLADNDSSAPACSEMEDQKGFAGIYDTDEFRLYCFKVLPCSKVGGQWAIALVLVRCRRAARCLPPSYLSQRVPHNWQQCVFAHWGEKAKRRDLRTHTYSSQLCPDAKREGGCPRGDACPMSHNVSVFHSSCRPRLHKDMNLDRIIVPAQPAAGWFGCV
jgi:hypothetical protein